MNIFLQPALFFSALSKISPGGANGLPQVSADQGSISTILGIAFTIIGALAVLGIVISGLRYVLAGSDPQAAAKAKNGIIYSLVGVVVAISAQAIVSYVVNHL